MTSSDTDRQRDRLVRGRERPAGPRGRRRRSARGGAPVAGRDATLATLDLAFYEVGNVAVRAWRDGQAAGRLQGLVDAIAADGGLVRVDEALIAHAVRIAETEGLSVYDAGYVAGAASAGAQLVSCDLRDLVSRDLAVTPRQAGNPGQS